MDNAANPYRRLLILTDLGTVRVLAFKEAGDDPRDRAHLVELSAEEIAPPRGAATTDSPGKFKRGAAAGNDEAMSHAETKLDIEVEKRAIAQVAAEICEVVARLKCQKFVLAAPPEHLKRLEEEMPADCRQKMQASHRLDLTKISLKELEKRFL
ncbi:MAG: host attachment protein [Verrucomicrobiales bacterium]